ncbi:MAG: DUF5053 domain-containing protein [Bacteroidaceae bacterium]|nr:DUF5053 domain-containing protein [Bacteroidaceae bacterium]
MEITIQQPATLSVKQRMADVLVSISWGDVARRYFGKSPSWLYHKMNGTDGNGRPTDFTPAEAEQLRGALCDLSDRLRRAAETL